MRSWVPALAAGAVLWVMPLVSAAATWTWTGNLDSSPWDTDGQWTDPGSPAFDDAGAGPHGDDLVFPTAPSTATVNLRNLDANDAALSILFEANGPAYTFQRAAFPAQPVHLWGNMTNNSAATQTFASGIALDGAIVVSGAQGDPATHCAFDFGHHLSISGAPAYIGPFDARVTGTGAGALKGSGTFTINDATIVVEGGWDGTLTKNGNGTLVLNGHSTTTSKMTVAEGIVRVGQNTALGLSSSTRNTVLSGGTTGTGTLQFYRNITVSEYVSLSGRQQAAGSVVALENQSDDNVFNGTLSILGAGSQYNFGSLAGKLTIATNVVFPASLTGGRYISFRGPGSGEFSGSLGANNLGIDAANPGHTPIVHQGSGVLTLSGADNWRLGHVMSIGGGTLKFAATFANIEVDQTNYPLFAPMDDLAVQNATRFVLLNGSTFDFSAATATGGSNIGLAGGGLLLNRTLAGSGTVIGNVQTAATGAPALKPGDGVAWDPADVSGAALDPDGAFVAGVGTLTFANDLDMSSGPADYEWHLAALADQTGGTAGADWDLIRVRGQTRLAVANKLTLSFALTPDGGPSSGDAFWTAGHTWRILDTDVNGSGSDAFGTITLSGTFVDNGTFAVTLGSGSDEGDVFLNWVPAPVRHLADIDGDGDVDRDDRGLLTECYNGPALPFVPGCANRDLDLDSDVDQTDFGIWQACFTGAGTQATIPGCTQTVIPPPQQP